MNTLYPNIGISDSEYTHVSDVVDFFVRELEALSKHYPEAYDEENIAQYIRDHQMGEMLQKIHDPSRFFRIIRNEKGVVIGYFESKQNSIYPDTQTIQWIFIDEAYRWSGLARQLWDEFTSWCHENSYKSVWSFVALQNTISQEVHRKLMPSHMQGLYDSETFIFVESLSAN